uniref:cbb3-type cytochrome c oxidase subunit I n=1 Tax=Oceanobacillus massiliensis TaxID=1465765 RepID=UPI003017FD1B
HNVILPGVVFAMIAGLIYWWPKMFGFMLNERIGKWAFWFITVGFCLAFFPMYITGLDGQARRMYTYSEATGFGPLNMLSFFGAGLLAIGFVIIVYNVYYSFRYAPRNVGDDPWNARSLEWATHNPVPEYNFALTPNVVSSEALWDAKKNGHPLFKGKLEEIHMPNNSGAPIIMAGLFFVLGFSAVFYIWPGVIIAGIGILICLAYRSFEKDHGRHISTEEIQETEDKFGGANK